MKISDTVIRWKVVNMRAKERNLPEVGKCVVYYSGGIYDGVVAEYKEKLYVNFEFKKKEIKTGFLWCYQNDIEQPHEID